MQPKLNSLESLRGLAAVGVVFFHFRMHSSFDNRFVQDLWLMVDFFFVLSGFVVNESSVMYCCRSCAAFNSAYCPVVRTSLVHRP